MQMKKIISVLLVLLLSASVFAAMASNGIPQVAFLAEPVALTLVKPLPTAIYKTNTYTTVFYAQNNGADIPLFYANLQVLKDGQPYDGSGLTVQGYWNIDSFYKGTTPYTTIEEYIASGSAWKFNFTSFDSATGTYKTDGALLPAGTEGHIAMQVLFGSSMPSGNYVFNAYGSDSP